MEGQPLSDKSLTELFPNHSEKTLRWLAKYGQAIADHMFEASVRYHEERANKADQSYKP